MAGGVRHMLYARFWAAQPLMFTPEVTGLATLSIGVRGI